MDAASRRVKQGVTQGSLFGWGLGFLLVVSDRKLGVNHGESTHATEKVGGACSGLGVGIILTCRG